MINLSELSPFVIKDVLSKEDYSYVYECVNSGFPKKISPDLPPDSREDVEYLNIPELGYLAYVKGFKKEFRESIKNTLEKTLNIPLELPQIHFARYTPQTGSPPALRPHNDKMLKYPAVTISIQMDSTLDWELCAYDKCATLSKNEALVFSGSHQIHWRPVKEFLETDYLDIMVCQFTTSSEQLSQDHIDQMDALSKTAIMEYFMKYPHNVHNLKKM